MVGGSTPGPGYGRRVCRISNTDSSSDQENGHFTDRLRREGGRGDFGAMWKFSLRCGVKPETGLGGSTQTCEAKPWTHTSLPTFTEGRIRRWKVDGVRA